MNDEELDRLITSALMSDAQINQLAVDTGEQTLLEEIMAVTTPSTPHRSRRSVRTRRRWLAGAALGGLIVSGGAAYAAFNALTPEQSSAVDVVRQLTADNAGGACSLDPATAQLVATTTYGGQRIEYWTFDDATSHADVIFEDSEGGGSAGCGPVPRAEAHPESTWAEYTLAVNGDTSTFTVYGQAPVGSQEATIEFNNGTVTSEVGENGYFVTVAELPTVANDTLISITTR
ncbi:MAG: hypothetical protein ACOYL9_15465 [Ilumatobacteraceae bacterium]